LEGLKETMQAVADGDRAAFASLYNLTSPRLMGVALYIVRRRDWAEEVLQEGFVSIWRKAASFDSARGAVLPWMATVIRYRAIDFLRALRRETDARNTLRDAAPDGAALIPPLETNLQLSRCLAKLHENHRNAVILSFYNGFSHGELAETLGVPLGTAKSWVRRGLGQLKECLDS